MSEKRGIGRSAEARPPYIGALFSLLGASTHADGWAAYKVHHWPLCKVRNASEDVSAPSAALSFHHTLKR